MVYRGKKYSKLWNLLILYNISISFCYYIIPGTDEFLQVKLKRSFNCTAFKTWEACFAFLEWSFENKGMLFFTIIRIDRFIQKRIVELGSGSGLCGQMLEAMIKDCSVIMSDYCNDVAEYIQGNIEESKWIDVNNNKIGGI